MFGAQAVAETIGDLLLVVHGTGGVIVAVTYAAAHTSGTAQWQTDAEVDRVAIVAVGVADRFFHRRRDTHPVVTVAPGQEQALIAVVLVVGGLGVAKAETANHRAPPAQAGAELVAVTGGVVARVVGAVEEFAVALATMIYGDQARPLFVQLPVQLAAQLQSLVLQRRCLRADGRCLGTERRA
ncbi:hypothetical protein D3C80_1225190 [compost metagenome]